MIRPIAIAGRAFLGWRYATKSGDNRFPTIKGCLPAGLLHKPGDPRLIDCSTFITALACYAFPDTDWDAQAYADMQIMDATRLWSPVDAWARHGLGTRVEDSPADGWGFYQSWVDDKAAEFDGDPISGGHQWAYHGRLKLRLHSSSRGAVGPTLDRGVTWESLESYYKDGIMGVTL
jgi:hypothetical protein